MLRRGGGGGRGGDGGVVKEKALCYHSLTKVLLSFNPSSDRDPNKFSFFFSFKKRDFLNVRPLCKSYTDLAF